MYIQIRQHVIVVMNTLSLLNVCRAFTPNMHLSLALLIVLIAHFFQKCSSQGNVEFARTRVCQTYDTCDSCIQVEEYCSWCFQDDFSGDRCGLKSVLLKNGCNSDSLFVNEGHNSTPASSDDDSDKPFSDVTQPDNLEESVQIKPQKVTLNLYPNQPINMKLKYRLAKNYPLDLYYLMDLTKTMENDITTMTTLGKELTEVLRNLSLHFRVAFGYYSDKVAMPFAKMTKEYLDNPCFSAKITCKKGFDFVHSLNFTNKVDKFIKEISKSETTANLDNLEGGLDALLQVILCENQIRWRKNSRRVVVIATDGILHTAGDGILAGAVKRNVEECMLDTNGVYVNTLIYDYPSVEEIFHLLLKHKMNIIVAAKEDTIQYYNKLHKVIPTVSFIGTLAENSTNVIELVKEGYMNVVKNVEFLPSKSDNIKITWLSSNKLSSVEEGKEYEFDFTIEAKHIPKDIDREIITIEEKNIAEKLQIEIVYKGKCNNCNKKVNMLGVDSVCSGNGKFICGACECQEGWKGKFCNKNCMVESIEDCREKNETYTSATCHGRGDCECGKCICDEEYTGKFCQERQCIRSSNGKICGGSEHGECLDGLCHCTNLYTGLDCTCIKSQKSCIAPGSTSICNGYGQCECGKCKCNKEYVGTYCESSESGNALCNIYEECVLEATRNSTESQNCATNTSSVYKPKFVEEPIEDGFGVCTTRYEDNNGKVCIVRYKYKITKNYVELPIYPHCEEPVQAGMVAGVIGGIIAIILGIGIIAILFCKAKLMFEDRREYAKFQKHVESTKMKEVNPLYNSPIRKYEMPQKTD